MILHDHPKGTLSSEDFFDNVWAPESWVCISLKPTELYCEVSLNFLLCDSLPLQYALRAPEFCLVILSSSLPSKRWRKIFFKNLCICLDSTAWTPPRKNPRWKKTIYEHNRDYCQILYCPILWLGLAHSLWVLITSEFLSIMHNFWERSKISLPQGYRI